MKNLKIGATTIVAFLEPGIEKTVYWFNHHGMETSFSGEWNSHFRQFGGRGGVKNSSFISFVVPLPLEVTTALNQANFPWLKVDKSQLRFTYEQASNRKLVESRWAEIVDVLEKTMKQSTSDFWTKKYSVSYH